MKDPETLGSVKKFHNLFQLPVLNSPKIPSEDRCKLRLALLEEELSELKEAIENNDLVEVADALCDIQYVLSGAILEFGLGNKFKELFDEVQRSNMSKACSTYEEAEATKEKYIHKDGTESYIKEVDGQFLVYRKSDKKVLKSVNYSPADLKRLIE